MKAKISIVIPIYNVEKYLKRCLESVINQTYSNIEIILIDDGSTDSSGRIAEEYALKDSRIILIHKTNGGLSDARNVGIDKCNGEYITFIDSDDFIELNYIDRMMELMKLYKADVVICNNLRIYESIVNIKKREKKQIYTLDNVAACKKILYQKGFDVSAWGKIFNIKLFEGVRFPTGYNFEDIPTTYKAIWKADNICFTNERLYNYQIRMNSIENEPFNFKKLDGIYTGKLMLDDINKDYPELYNAARSRFVAINFHILYQINVEIKEIDEIKKNIKAHRLMILLDKNVKIKIKVACLLSYFNINYTIKLLRKLKK